jgi:hypothetical protein
MVGADATHDETERRTKVQFACRIGKATTQPHSHNISYLLLTAVLNILYLHNSAKGTQWCISMKTLNTYTAHSYSCANTRRGERMIALHDNNRYTNAPQCNVARNCLYCYYTVIQIPQKLRLLLSTSLSADSFTACATEGNAACHQAFTRSSAGILHYILGRSAIIQVK